MYHAILVPLDGSTVSAQALPLACTIARQCSARIRLAHVHVPPVDYYLDNVPVIDPELERESRVQETAYLEKLRAQIASDTECSVDIALLEGPITEALAQAVTASDTDLVVMTTHGRAGMARMWLGSIADSLVRRLAVPIVLLRPQGMLAAPVRAYPPAQILVALDGSPLAEQVLPHIMAMGNPLEAEYTLLQAVEPFMLPGYIHAAYPHQVEDDATIWHREQALEYLEHMAHRLRLEGLRVRTRVAIDRSTAAAILEDARDHKVDLIAMATHGRGGLARLMIGSVAAKVLHRAECPVLLYRPPRVPEAKTTTSAEPAYASG